MEWQNESSLFSVRVRARQWYWIYKFELRHIVDIASVPRNIGNNRWAVIFGGAHEVSNDYVHALKLRNQNVWLSHYWNDYVKMLARMTNDTSYTLNYDRGRLHKSAVEGLANLNFNTDLEGDGATFTVATGLQVLFPHEAHDSLANHLAHRLLPQKGTWTQPAGRAATGPAATFLNKRILFATRKTRDLVGLAHDSAVGAALLKPNTVYLDTKGNKVTTFEATRQVKKIISEVQPVLVTRTVLSLSRLRSLTEASYSLVNANFNKEKSIEQKEAPEGGFFVIKQKRYKVRNVIPLRLNYDRLNPLVEASKLPFEDRPNLSNTLSFISQLEFEPTKLYRALKKNRNREEAMSGQLSRRLMRTRKTLVLPAHANITLVTNSYDVVHSWFIPSLGVKMDCVPGRSTHHTFYVDNLGFFYGQCAEICGRYHHHMPIRICMLPYEHFFVWWQHFGLPKVLNIPNRDRLEASYSSKVFNW